MTDDIAISEHVQHIHETVHATLALVHFCDVYSNAGIWD